MSSLMKRRNMMAEPAPVIPDDWDGYALGTWPTGEVVIDTATTVKDYSFRYRYDITSLRMPSVNTIQSYAFDNCTSLASVTDCDSVTSIATYGFAYCPVGNMYFKNLTTLSGGYDFGYASNNGNALVCPSLTSIAADSTRASKFSKFDFGENLNSLNTRTFYQTNVGNSGGIIVLRNKTQVVTATATNCLSDVGANTKVYVPSDLIASYKAASGWSAKGDIFYAIEGSEYEHYYADGTPIPAA